MEPSVSRTGGKGGERRIKREGRRVISDYYSDTGAGECVAIADFQKIGPDGLEHFGRQLKQEAPSKEEEAPCVTDVMTHGPKFFLLNEGKWLGEE